MLLAITVVAVGLRAAALRFPPALTDEAFTFWRICGTLGQLLDCLRDDAFVPLHYEVLWALTKWFGTDIWVLRLPAAVAGAVMPSAIYRTGRLIGGRRVGVAAAAVAASSEFLAYFARDAKMYMPAWTCMMLALGSLLFFARARKGMPTRRLAWLTFVLFGVAATSMHAVVCIPLAMSPLLCIAWARRRRWRVFMLTLLATAIVMMAPAIYYTAINTWFVRAGGLSGRSEEGAAQRDNGLMWIAAWQSGRSPGNLLMECLSAYTGGIEWPAAGEKYDDSFADGVRRATGGVMLGLAGCAILGALACVVRGGRGIGVAPLVGCLLLIALPFYGFYLRSYRALAPPWELGWIAWTLCAFSCAAVMADGRRGWRIRLSRGAAWMILVAVGLTLAWAGARYAYAHAPLEADGEPRWNPLWMPRYSGFVAPLLCVVIAAIICNTPTTLLRWTLGGSVLGLNLWLSLLSVHDDTEVPWPQIVHDVVAVSRGEDPGVEQPTNRKWAVAMDWVRWPGQSFMSILPAPYYALVTQEGTDVDPPGFRNGSTWPYRPGPDVLRTLATLRYQSTRFLPMFAAHKRFDSIVLWRMLEGNSEGAAIPSGWHVVEKKVYLVRFVWNWRTIGKYERLVLSKD